MSARRHKYNAVRTDGFASKAEAERAKELQLMEKAGAITELEYQPAFVISPKGCSVIGYRADFRYFEGERVIVEDVKGLDTALWRLKAKLFRWSHPHHVLRVSRRLPNGAFTIEDLA